ncbi:hypothetical protein J6590_038905 [Homalodisca vitripennis]|nr:hypothetical protein J6590_038905 [Homalodisca vitripennis]
MESAPSENVDVKENVSQFPEVSMSFTTGVMFRYYLLPDVNLLRSKNDLLHSLTGGNGHSRCAIKSKKPDNSDGFVGDSGMVSPKRCLRFNEHLRTSLIRTQTNKYKQYSPFHLLCTYSPDMQIILTVATGWAISWNVGRRPNANYAETAH